MVIAFLVSGGWFLRKTGLIEERGVLGGPAVSFIPDAQGAEIPAAAIVNAGNQVAVSDPNGSVGSYAPDLAPGVLNPSAATVGDPGQPVGPAFDRSGTVSYTVQRGDTPAKIASYFGISVETIASANPGVKSAALRAGEELAILPTSGVVYTTRGGDTLQSIADAFGIAQSRIAQFNPSVNFGSLDPGVSVIIPGGKNMNAVTAGGAALPNLKGRFIAPAAGYDWGILHHYNAVDIANS